MSMREPLSRNQAPTPRRGGRSAVPTVLWVGVLLLALAGAATWFLLRSPPPPEPAAEAAAPPPVSAATPARGIVGDTPAATSPPPAAAAEPEVPLPPLDDSDAEVSAALTQALGAPGFAQFLRPNALIRNLVVTIDNLARPALPLERRSVPPTPGAFATSGAEDALVLDSANYSRYTPFVTLVSRTDAGLTVAIYRRFYPLLQQAYLELGNPDQNFNARVIAVIDDLVAAPEIAGPIELAQPSVLYTFKDPALESLSSGRKILIRMGPTHAEILKAKLREIRALIAR